MLEPLGLDADAETLYKLLVEEPLSEEKARAALGWSEPRLASALTALISAGLVRRAEVNAEPALVANAAGPALERLHAELKGELAARAAQLEDAQAQVARFLLSLPFATGNAAQPRVEFVAGRREAGERLRQVQESAQHSVRVLDRPPYPYHVPTGEPQEQQLRVLARGVRYRVIYDAKSVGPSDISDCLAQSIAAGEGARVMADVPLKLIVADDSIAAVVLVPRDDDDPGGALLFHDPLAVQPFCAMYDSLWERAIPLGSRDAVEAAADQSVSAEDRTLLMLLATGMKDGAIARSLRISERTANRRIAELIERLEAQTRFQAGLQAARRGWL